MRILLIILLLLMATPVFAVDVETSPGSTTIGAQFIDPAIKRLNPTVYANGTAGATITIDLSNGDVQSVTFGQNCVVTISNWPTTGTKGVCELWVTNGGSYSITWPDSFNPTLTAAGTDVVVITTIDGGSNIGGGVAIEDF